MSQISLAYIMVWCACYSAAYGGLHQADGTFLVKVYSYPLPELYQNASGVVPLEEYSVWAYGSEKRIPEALEAAGYLTTDPEQADFFLVPAWLYSLVHQLQVLQSPDEFKYGASSPSDAVAHVLHHIQTGWPFWNASQGRDHIWIMSFDHGFCGFDVEQGSTDAIADSIILSHWGLTSLETPCPVAERIQAFGQCARRVKAAHALAAGKPLPGALPCFATGKDVVVPPASWDEYAFLPGGVPDGSSYAATLQHFQQTKHHSGHGFPVYVIAEEKEHKLFFAGAIRHSVPSYSHGVRQTLMMLFNDTPGFKLVNSEKHELGLHELFREMGRSHFCLAPSGDGFGARLKLAIATGCLPIVIQDGVEMAFEDILPYQDFALRLPQHMLYRLPEILDDILAQHSHQNQSKVEVMRARLPCAAKHMSWAEDHGLAVHVLACVLKQRKHGIKHVQASMNWDRCEFQCQIEQLPHD